MDTILAFQSDENYLLPNLLPAATSVHLEPGEPTADLVARLPSDTGRLIFHLNASDTASSLPARDELLRLLAERGIRTLNGEVRCSGKRFVQETLSAVGARTVATEPNGSAEDWVFVKTDRNHGGRAERSADPGRVHSCPIGGPAAYQVVRRGAVPDSWWAAGDLVVERYVSNLAGLFIRVYVAGEAIVISRAWESSAVKRMVEGIRRVNTCTAIRASPRSWTASDLREQILLGIRAFHMDYGTLDVVCDDEHRSFIIDVNPTPWWGTEDQPDITAHLTAGLYALNSR